MIVKFVAVSTLLVLVKSEPPVPQNQNDQDNLNSENAFYKFSYDVQDPQTGDNKVHTETRDGDVVKGQYSFDDSDGTRRIVEYTADSVNGFKATIRKEPLPELAANSIEKSPSKPFIPTQEKDAEIIQTKQTVQGVQTFSRVPQVQTFGNFGARVAQPNLVNVPPVHRVAAVEPSKPTSNAVPQNHIVRVTQYVPATAQVKPTQEKPVLKSRITQQPLVEVVRVQSAPGAEKVYSFSQYISGPVSGNAVSAKQTELVDTVEVEAVPATPAQTPLTQIPGGFPPNFIQYAPVQSSAPVVRIYRPGTNNVVYERVTSPLSYTFV